MLSSAVVETVIGLAFVFFLVAILCTALVEFIATRFKKRAKYLLRGLRDLLDQPEHLSATGPKLASPRTLMAARAAEKDLYTAALAARSTGLDRTDEPAPVGPPSGSWAMGVMGHALARVYRQTRANGEVTTNPAYLPAATFSRALIDLVWPGSGEPMTVAGRRREVEAHEAMPFKDAILALLKTAGDDIDEFRTSLESWYDAKMAQISGAYKRWAKRWAIVFGIAVAVFFNVDTIAIATSLHEDGPLRAAVVAAATSGTLCEQGQDFDETKQCVDDTLGALAASGLPVGWDLPITREDFPSGSWGIPLKILGLLITAGAASFGAPFWFDALSRVASLRNTGDRPTSRTS